MLNRADEEGVEMWNFEAILKHRWSPKPGRKGKVDVLIKWKGYEEPTWEPMEAIKKDDPVTLEIHAQTNGQLNKSIWTWANAIVNFPKDLQE